MSQHVIGKGSGYETKVGLEGRACCTLIVALGVDAICPDTWWTTIGYFVLIGYGGKH